jgi:diguanylate cyclase (GGDEF)-like protein
MHVTASVGVSMYPEHGGTVEALMKNADLALYETKRAGKNHYRFASQHAPSS